MFSTALLDNPDENATVQVQFDLSRGILFRLVHVAGWGIGFPFVIFLIVALSCSIDATTIAWVFFGFSIALISIAARVYRHHRHQRCSISPSQIVLRGDRMYKVTHRVALIDVQDVTVSYYACLDRRAKQRGQEQLASLVIHAGADNQDEVPVIKLEAVKDAESIRKLILSRRDRALQRLEQSQQLQVMIPVAEPVEAAPSSVAIAVQQPPNAEQSEDNHKPPAQELSALKRRLQELEQSHSALEMQQLRAQIAEMESSQHDHQAVELPPPKVLDPSAPSEDV